MFSNLIEYFVPGEYHKTEESSRKARLAVGVYLVVAIFALSYSIISVAINYWGGIASQVPLLVVTVLCLFLYRSKVKPDLVAFLFFTEAIISISVTIYYSGGFNSFILPWLATTPIVALLVSGKQMGLYTLFGQLMMLTMFYFFEKYDINPPVQYIADFPDLFILSCQAGLILLLYAIANFFESGKSEAMGLMTKKNDELEQTIQKLKNTQDQLVQQEKLASLGHLTAGISHELKNPLNFVNNFSELSIELIEEAKDELTALSRKQSDGSENSPIEESAEAERRRGVSEKATNNDLILNILQDIENNLQTIHKHGSRADSIIKSMLQHSRGSGVIMEPTELNPLLKEFVNLSFHGMRAGDRPFEVDIEFDLDPSIGEVPIIAEDFSRVMVNLCNNAFDAMREKVSSENTENYIPKLFVRTIQKDQIINVIVEDNGTGIPEKLRKKILQPFFTTKKGTEGTGLGLYITNDIIKAHGGMLYIQSEENSFTRFIIELNRSK